MSRLPTPSRGSSPRLVALAVSLAVALAVPMSLRAQATTAGAPPVTGTAVTPAQVRLLAELHVSLAAVHDSADARAAQARNKTREAQHELAKQKREAVAKTITARGLTEDDFQRLRYAVSTNAQLRAQFDSVVATLTGAPLPGRVAAVVVPGFVAASALPSGMAGTHVGHVTTSYVDTPDKSGLLPMAFAEAAVAAQHATLATRTPNDLAAMQLHAGHVLHALDPAVVATGPGKGFGLRKASGGVAQHMELAAKEPSATPAITTHAPHIAAAARATLARAEQAIAVANQIRAATDAKVAASLVAQLASLCAQLTTGTDVNADGRVSWDKGEGGLQQAEEHVRLMIAR